MTNWSAIPSAVAVHPRVILALTAFAALVAAALPGGSNLDSLRLWWNADPPTALAGVSCLLALPLLMIASWAANGRGAGMLGAALVMLGAILLGIADRPKCGSLLVAVGALASIGAVANIASPRNGGAGPTNLRDEGASSTSAGDGRAPPMDWTVRWNLGAGAGLLLICVVQLARQSAAGPALLSLAPPIPTVGALLLGAALFISGMLGRRKREIAESTARAGANAHTASPADADTRRRRAAIAAIVLAILLALLVPILALIAGDRATALAGARASMLAVAASASLGALFAPDLRRNSRHSVRDEPHHDARHAAHRDALPRFTRPLPARPASETPHGHH